MQKQTQKFRLLSLAVLSALAAQGAVAEDFNGENYAQSGNKAFENVTVTNADQTTQSAVNLSGSNDQLSVSNALKVTIGRTSASTTELTGVFVSNDNATLQSKHTDILVENKAETDNVGLVGLSTFGSVTLDGAENKIKVVNQKGNNYIQGLVVLGGGTVTGSGLTIEVDNQVAWASTGEDVPQNNTYGVWQGVGDLDAENLTISAKGNGYVTQGLHGQTGVATIGKLEVTVSSAADGHEDFGGPLVSGIEIATNSSEYELNVDSMTIVANGSEVEGSGTTGIVLMTNGDTENERIALTSEKTNIRVDQAYTAEAVRVENFITDDNGNTLSDLVSADFGQLSFSVKALEADGVKANGGALTVSTLDGQVEAIDDATGLELSESKFTASGDVQLQVQAERATGIYLDSSAAVFDGKVGIAVNGTGRTVTGMLLGWDSTAEFNDLVTIRLTSQAPAEGKPGDLIGVDVSDSNTKATFKKGLAVVTDGASSEIGNIGVNADEGTVEIAGELLVQVQPGAYAMKAQNGGVITVAENGDLASLIEGYLWSKGENSRMDIALDASDVFKGRTALTGNGAINLSLSDGALWQIGEGKSTVTTLASTGGTLSFADPTTTLAVDTLTLTGKTVVGVEDVAADGGTYIAANTIQGDGTIRVEAPSTYNDNRGDSLSDAVTSLADSVLGANASDKVTELHLEEGKIFGAVDAVRNEAGDYDVTERANGKLEALKSVAALSAFQWRHDMNDLTKRMGELRTSPEGIGAWVRLYGSEQEYGAQNVQAKNTSIQVGSDFDVGAGWKVGAAFTYTDGESTYADGSADNKAYGLGIYGTWMAENGQFVDLIAKYSRMDTDFALNGMNGGFDNNAYSLSAEYGWHLKLGEFAFVEPQAELTYGQVSGDTFTTANGVKVEQDDFDAFIGRIGVRGGFTFPDNKGSVYVRASVLHDFEGESSAVASLVSDSSVRSSLKDDLGGTWYEVGVGANFNVTDNTYTYVDLEKTSGGEVKENWRWNVGMRYVW